MSKKLVCGIDIGSSAIKVAIFQLATKTEKATLLALVSSPAEGITKGYIRNIAAARNSILKAKNKAEKIAGTKITHARIGISTFGMKSQTIKTTVVLTKADGEVTEHDIERATNEAERKSKKLNRKIIEVLPIRFALDGESVEGRPEGMRGNKLECETFVLSCSEQHMRDIVDVLNELGIEATEIVPSILAAGEIVLADRDVVPGTALVDIGQDLTTCAVFGNGSLIFLNTYPIGGGNITRDIAIGFQVDLDRAEGWKTGAILDTFPKKKFDNIIEARLEDIFSLVKKDLDALGPDGIVPAGINLIGGGALTLGATEQGLSILKMPVRLASAKNTEHLEKIRDVSWYALYGLVFGASNIYSQGSLTSSWFHEIKRILENAFKQLAP